MGLFALARLLLLYRDRAKGTFCTAAKASFPSSTIGAPASETLCEFYTKTEKERRTKWGRPFCLNAMLFGWLPSLSGVVGATTDVRTCRFPQRDIEWKSKWQFIKVGLEVFIGSLQLPSRENNHWSWNLFTTLCYYLETSLCWSFFSGNLLKMFYEMTLFWQGWLEKHSKKLLINFSLKYWPIDKKLR